MNCPKCREPLELLTRNCPSCGAELSLAPPLGWRVLLAFRFGLLTFAIFFMGMVASGGLWYFVGPTHSAGLFPVHGVGLVVLFALAAFLKRPGWRAVLGVTLSAVLAVVAVYCLLDAQHFSLTHELFGRWPFGMPQR